MDNQNITKNSKTNLYILIGIVVFFILSLSGLFAYSFFRSYKSKMYFHTREIPLDITRSIGPKGPQGETGEKGIEGIEGPVGPRGYRGISGLNITGITGPQGDEGPIGAYPIIIPDPVRNIIVNAKSTSILVTISPPFNEDITKSGYIFKLYSKQQTVGSYLFVKEKDKYNYPGSSNIYRARFDNLSPTSIYKITVIHTLEIRNSSEESLEFTTTERDDISQQYSLNPIPDIETSFNINNVQNVTISSTSINP